MLWSQLLAAFVLGLQVCVGVMGFLTGTVAVLCVVGLLGSLFGGFCRAGRGGEE